MVLASFYFKDKLGKIQFIKEIFLVIVTSINIILGMLFFNLNNENMVFKDQKLTLRSYTLATALLTTKWVKIINQKEFAVTTLESEKEAFVTYLAFFNLSSRMSINPIWEA